jgi:hypothetical protein
VRSPSGSVWFRALFFWLFFCGCGAATTRSGIDAGGGGHGARGQAGTNGAAATGGATMTGGAAGSGGAGDNGGAGGSGGAAGRGGAAGTRGLAGSGGAAGNGGAAASGGAASGGSACDSNGDGLDDVASCLTAPASLRLVNATSDQTFDVFVTGALHPLAAGLAPLQVVVVKPVQAKLLDYEFRASGASPASGNSKLTGETNLQAYGGTTLIAYFDPTSDAGTLATNAAPQPPVGACPSGAEVAIGNFTTLSPTPAVVFYSAGQAASWTPAVSPGLEVGQLVDTSCWNAGPSLRFGAGPAGADGPASQYQAVVFASSFSYQLLLTDDRIIEIDNLDQVSTLPSSSGP